VPLFLVVAGTVGYTLIEGWPLLDALYMTVITLSTIGYGETHPLSTAGRVFTMLLILGGVYVFLSAAMAIIRTIVSGEMAELLGKQQMERTLSKMKDHILVCGFGRMGRLVGREFSRQNVPFVVIDESAEALRDFNLMQGVSVVGDATTDEVLKHAGVERARGLVTVMDSDADNLFVTMSARILNSKLYIVARVEDLQSEKKLLRAGANRVVSPYQIGGTRVAQAVLRPTVVDFIELATRTEHIELQMEECLIAAHSSLVAKSLRESRVREILQVIIVAIKKQAGHMQFNPPADAVLEQGDILIAMGHKEQLDRLDQLALGEIAAI
jgi:voltage-gated potassium channel